MSLKCQIIPYKDKTDWVLVVTFGFIIILLMALGGAIYGLSEAYYREHPTLSDMRPYVIKQVTPDCNTYNNLVWDGRRWVCAPRLLGDNYLNAHSAAEGAHAIR